MTFPNSSSGSTVKRCGLSILNIKSSISEVFLVSLHSELGFLPGILIAFWVYSYYCSPQGIVITCFCVCVPLTGEPWQWGYIFSMTMAPDSASPWAKIQRPSGLHIIVALSLCSSWMRHEILRSHIYCITKNQHISFPVPFSVPGFCLTSHLSG